MCDFFPKWRFKPANLFDGPRQLPLKTTRIRPAPSINSMNSKSVISQPDQTANANSEAKWIAIVSDQFVQIHRRHVTARHIKAEAGLRGDFVLVRDHNSPQNVFLADEIVVDLAHGNVFYVAPMCSDTDRPTCTAPAKQAFSVNDHWKVVTQAVQTGGALRKLFELGEDVELVRATGSPSEVLVAEDDLVHLADGPVFHTQARKIVIILVNNREVKMLRGTATALEIKQAAIKQQVNICADCVLYLIKPDGSHSAAIHDHERVRIECGAQFRCIAPDDNS
jgi:hypothetical protein